MDKLNVWPCIPVPMRLVCLCYLWWVSLSQWEWTWMSGWLLGLCYWKQCAQSARLTKCLEKDAHADFLCLHCYPNAVGDNTWAYFFFRFERFASKMRFSGMYINAFSRNSIKAETRGSWRTIVVDDLVPVDSNGPRACRPGDSRATALWPSIIEKAFAKACGSYEKMDFVGSWASFFVSQGSLLLSFHSFTWFHRISPACLNPAACFLKLLQQCKRLEVQDNKIGKNASYDGHFISRSTSQMLWWFWLARAPSASNWHAFNTLVTRSC